MRKDFKYPSSNNYSNIHGIVWKNEDNSKPVGIVQIIHGMSEYIGRYEEFAEFLVSKGYIVLGNDHLGHGASVKDRSEYGYFGKDGNRNVIADIHNLRKKTMLEYPNVPYYFLGHSMGSFLLRQYLSTVYEEFSGEDIRTYSHGISGAIVMGTGWQPNFLLGFGKGLCKLLSIFKKWNGRSKLLDTLAFGSYYKRIPEVRTPNDWLSVNQDNVDNYINDPMCGFTFTINGYYNLFKAIGFAQDKSLMQNIDDNMPILFIAGAEDPVGAYGEGVRKAFIKYKENTGCQCDIKLYEEDRHEILNENNRKEIFEDILAWLRKE